MKRHLRGMALVALLAVMATACGGEPPPGGRPLEMLTVDQAVRLAEADDVIVGGSLFGSEGVWQLCSGLAESFPPQCGQPSLVLVGLAAGDVVGVQSAQGVDWLDELVVSGRLHDGELDVREVLRPRTDEVDAEAILRSYFDLLAAGRFTEAAALYGGPLDTLRSFAPGTDGTSSLLRVYCETAGGICLPVRDITERISGDSVETFVVEFANADGARLEIGPCCGDTGDPTSRFTYTVVYDDTGGRVMELPPYSP